MTLKEFKKLSPGNLLAFSKKARHETERSRFMMWVVGFGTFDIRPDPEVVMLVTHTNVNNVTVHFVNPNGQVGKGTIYRQDDSLGFLELVEEQSELQ